MFSVPVTVPPDVDLDIDIDMVGRTHSSAGRTSARRSLSRACSSSGPPPPLSPRRSRPWIPARARVQSTRSRLAPTSARFTLAFSALLAGLLWRAILRQKGVYVRARQFLVLNLPILAVAMAGRCMSSIGGDVWHWMLVVA